jgi:hypothetical protein
MRLDTTASLICPTFSSKPGAKMLGYTYIA